MNLNTYFITYMMFSPLKPIILNKKIGKHRNINKKIFNFKVIENKLIIVQTNTYQIIFSIAVE